MPASEAHGEWSGVASKLGYALGSRLASDIILGCHNIGPRPMDHRPRSEPPIRSIQAASAPSRYISPSIISHSSLVITPAAPALKPLGNPLDSQRIPHRNICPRITPIIANVQRTKAAVALTAIAALSIRRRELTSTSEIKRPIRKWTNTGKNMLGKNMKTEEPSKR